MPLPESWARTWSWILAAVVILTRRAVAGAAGEAAVLVGVTVLAALAAPHTRTLRGLVAGGLPDLPAIRLPGRAPAASDGARAARAVAFALRQRGKPYQWGAEGPGAYDCS